jgi:hypothetical protein
MKFIRLLQGKLIVVALVSVAVVGGTTAFAATSAGQGLVHAITGQAHATATPDVESHGNDHQANKHQVDKSKKNTCPGLPDAQQLATQFALSTASTSDDIRRCVRCTRELSPVPPPTEQPFLPSGSLATARSINC